MYFFDFVLTIIIGAASGSGPFAISGAQKKTARGGEAVGNLWADRLAP